MKKDSDIVNHNNQFLLWFFNLICASEGFKLVRLNDHSASPRDPSTIREGTKCSEEPQLF